MVKIRRVYLGRLDEEGYIIDPDPNPDSAHEHVLVADCHIGDATISEAFDGQIYRGQYSGSDIPGTLIQAVSNGSSIMLLYFSWGHKIRVIGKVIEGCDLHKMLSEAFQKFAEAE